MSEYRAGIQVRQVAPCCPATKNVIDAFDEVSRARQDMDRLKNEAEAFRNDIVPRARGDGAAATARCRSTGRKWLIERKGMRTDSTRYTKRTDNPKT